MGKKRSNENKIDINDLKFYYGIPHAHCDFSTGRGTPIDAFDYARRNNLDFLILTDHNNHLDKKIKLKGNEISKWDAIKYFATRYNKRHDNFLALVGFESKTNPYGDMNIINSNNFFTGCVNNLKLLLIWMINNPSAFVSINHPHKTIHYLEYNPLLNKIITSIEVGNGSMPNKYSRYDKYYYFLLDRGWKLGAINSQDNHRLNFGDSENLTCVICNSLNTNSLINAFRNRKTYSTESRTLTMFFTINDYFMGDTLPFSLDSLQFSIFVEDSNYKILEIHIISIGGSLVKKVTDLNLNRVKYIYNHSPSVHEHWYVIKVILENDKIAISSPIFR